MSEDRMEFVVIVESGADARTATGLAERVLLEKIDWLELEYIPHMFEWTGLKQGSEYSCWKDFHAIMEDLKKQKINPPRYRDHPRHNQSPLKADGAAALKYLNLLRFLQTRQQRSIQAVLFIRDIDTQKERREGLEQARKTDGFRSPQLTIVIGTAYKTREAWVLNGFEPQNPSEKTLLDQIKKQLGFDPCAESHRLREASNQSPDRERNPKWVLGRLTENDKDRERDCWEHTALETLRQKGRYTGLTDYLYEVETRLVPLITKK